MSSFTVWYVLLTVSVVGGHVQGDLGIHPDKISCEHKAQRILAESPEGTVKWACHEMTVETREDGNEVVAFPHG